MGFENYISESEAATVAGVGIATLRRFAEAGYFTIETESDGLRLYPRSQLEKVFGVSRHDPAPNIPVPDFSPEDFQSNSDIADIKISHQAEVIDTPAKPIEQIVQTAIPTAQINHNPELERELNKVTAISEMQEKLILIREEEIRSLKDEREWLRARIEKLEDKSSRDQLLLLSETQTIKALITIQEQRRSPFRAALEWFGFIAPTPVNMQLPQRTSIEVVEPKEKADLKAAA